MQLPLKYSTGQYRPAGIPRINWNNPITRGMTACFILGENGTSTIDLVIGTTYRGQGANISRQNTQDGAAVVTSSLSASGIYVTGASVSPTNAVSVFARLFTNSDQSGANRFIFTNENVDSGSTNGYSLNYSNGIGLVLQAGNGSTFTTCTLSASLSANTAYSALGTFDGSNMKGYLNGVLTNTVALSGSLSYTRKPVIFNYDNNGSIGSSPFVGAINIVAIWNRPLSANEARYLDKTPYDFLIYPEDEIFALLTRTSTAVGSGAATTTYVGSTIATVVVVAATGGTAPYTYQWYRSTSSGFTPGVGSIVVGATSLTLNDTGLTSGTTYYYKNVVTDATLATSTSNQTSASPAVLAAGTITAVSQGDTVATVNIGNPTGGNSPFTYQWYRSTSNGFTPGGGNIIGGATNQTFNDTGLTNGTTYYYKNIVTDNLTNTATSAQLTVLPEAETFSGSWFGLYTTAIRPPQPAPAVTWGYNRLALWDDFNDISTIDVNNTLQPGYNWYVQMHSGIYPSDSVGVIPASALSVNDSILTINYTNPTGQAILTQTGYIGKTGQRQVGTSINNTGAYWECRMAFDPALSRIGSFNWPAFWAWDNQITLNNADFTNWSGRYTELDFMEFIPSGSGTGDFSYTDWDWNGTSNVIANVNNNLGIPSPDANFHTYGCLWVPMSRNGGTGLIKRYLDGVLMSSSQLSYSSSTISSQANTGATTGWLSGLDSSILGLSTMIDAGPNWPVYVDYVQVWQP